METVNSGSYRWDWVKASRDLKEMTWEEFHELFMSKYFLAFSPHEKSREFLKLKQGTITMLEYVAKFTELARFADDYLANDMAKVRKLKDGLKLSIKGKIVGHLLQDMDSMVKTALAIEREVDDAWSIRDSSASDKKKGDRSSYFSSKKKAKDFYSVVGSRTRPRSGSIAFCKVGDTSGLLVNQDRGHVTIATSLDT